MDNLILTLILAFVIIIVALLFLGIGWLITGKSKIKPGACGRAPNQNRDSSCGEKESCGLCEREKSDNDEIDNDKKV